MYSPAQSDIEVERDPAEAERAHTDLEDNAANPTATKWVYIAMFALLGALAIILIVFHGPGGAG